MSSQFPSPRHIVPTPPNGKVITFASAAATPEFMWDEDEDRVFSNIQFIGEKAVGVNNATDIEVHIRKEDGTYAKHLTIAPGMKYNWPAPVDGVQFCRRSFKIKVNTNNDGVRIIYS